MTDLDAIRTDVFNALCLVRMEAKQARGPAEINLGTAHEALERAWSHLEPAATPGVQAVTDLCPRPR